MLVIVFVVYLLSRPQITRVKAYLFHRTRLNTALVMHKGKQFF